MNFIKIEKYSTSNGPGLRNVIWCSGCPFKCEGCHNPETWDKNNGLQFTDNDYENLIKEFKNSNLFTGISLLGGEPLAKYNIETMTAIAKKFKSQFPNKTIWCWTGNVYENVKDLEIMQYIDVLVDGQFKLDLLDLHLKYAGSTNQRVIDIKKSRQLEKIIEYEE